MKRLSQLDGIRGVAVAAVIFNHLAGFPGLGMPRNAILSVVYRTADVGWLGVDIFFVLSGFLITNIILNERTERDFWKDFYLRRAFRILPAFTVVFAVTLIAAHLFVPSIHISTSYVVAALCFMANWTVVNFNEMPLLGHLWSLAVEEQFYFLWPQAAKRLKIGTLLKLALMLAAGSELVRISLALLHVNPYIVYKITPSRIDGLSIGAALAAGSVLPEVRSWLNRRWRQIAIVAAVLVPLAFFALHGSLFMFNAWSHVLAIPPTIVLVAALIHGSSQQALPLPLASFLGNPVLTYLGRRSYALYLIHVPIAIQVEDSRLHGSLSLLPRGIVVNLLLAISVIAVSLVLTELSWHLIENPFQSLRRALMRQRPAQEDATPHPESTLDAVRTPSSSGRE